LFASFQKYLCSAKIYWQGRELDLSILFKNDNSDSFESTIPGLGMKSTLFTLAQTGVFGPIDKLRKENAWEILQGMYDLTKRDLDARAQQKSVKSGT
jgi:7,8-dihydro-6-hydroxymethylpterin-pyrophosphokinase